MFPALEKLEIRGLNNMAEIWDKQVVPTESFPQLLDVSVWSCDKTVNVFPSYSWAQSQSLQSIDVYKCKSVQVIFSITEDEEEQREREGANNCSIIFPQLRKVELNDLEKLECFCGSATRSMPLYLFDPQVSFPSLEELSIERCSSITELWDKHVNPANSFPQLVDVQVGSCEDLVNVLCSNMLTMGKNLKRINVEQCGRMECVVSITGVEQSESIVFPYLREVELTNLTNLKSFWGYNSITSETQHQFEPQHTLRSRPWSPQNGVFCKYAK